MTSALWDDGFVLSSPCLGRARAKLPALKPAGPSLKPAGPSLLLWLSGTPDVFSTSVISSLSIPAGALLWGLVFPRVFLCWYLEELGISQKKREGASGEGSSPGCGVGTPCSVPTNPLCSALAQLSSPTPGRSSGAADLWKKTLGEVKFLPCVLPSPLTLLHFFLLTPEFQT